VFITSHRDSQTLGRIQSAAGPATCLAKPFTEQEIALAIEFNLYRHNAERERARLESQLRALTQPPA
jgi:FixJ family two-component response regulator